MTVKIPIRTVYDAQNDPTGLAEFQVGEVIGIETGGTGANTIAGAKTTLGVDNSNIRNLFSVTGSGSYNSTTGVITINGGVSSVGGVSGEVSNAQLSAAISTSGILNTSNVAEGTNLYYTNARARQAISVSGAGTYDSSTGVITVTGGVTSVGGATGAVSNVQLASGISQTGVLTTANVSEVSNLYFTDTRARNALSQGTGISYNPSSGSISANVTSVAGKTGAVTLTNADISGLTTANVSELNNLYYTNTRANSAIDGKVTKAFVENLSINIANSSITGNIIASQLQPTGVSASTYGGSGNVGVFVVDQQGRLTSASNAAIGGSLTGITGVGTIATGTWQGSSISTAYTDAKVTSVNGDTGAVSGLATTAANLRQFASTTSADLAAVISDETGSGALVFANTPTLTTPNIGAATGTSLVLSANVVAKDVVVQGNLVVTGTQTIINTETIELADNKIVLNSDLTGIPTQDAGLVVNRGSSANVELFWDETNDRWSINTGAATHILHNTGRDVVLGTETSGAYIGNITAGTGITTTGTPEEGWSVAVALATSGVSASTYGGAAVQPVITVDTYGRITSASNVTSTVANSQITGNIIASQIQPTGVTASTYGGAASVPVYTVDAQGRLTSAANVSIAIASGAVSGLATSATTDTTNATNISSGTLNAARLDTSGVTASTYGAAAVQTVITVDTYGRITSAANVTSTVANSNITGNIIASQIQPTGVTSGTYGNATIIPIITIDQQGRITSAANASVSSGTTITDDTSTNTTHYVPFTTATSGSISSAKVSSSKLTFNPSSGLLTSTDYNSSSDKRLKKEIKTYKDALSKVTQLRGVSFKWKESDQTGFGLLAQEVLKVIPEIVVKDESGYLGIKYMNLIGILVEAIKEQQDQIDTLKDQINKLNG